MDQDSSHNEPTASLPLLASSLPPLPPTPDPLVASAGATLGAGLPVMAPELANDSDNIEKEWVGGAKAILFQSRGDPYTQNQQITRFKADYMKKRYNKDLIITED